MKKPEHVEISPEEADSLLARVNQSNLSGSDKDLVCGVVEFCLWMLNTITKTKMTFKKLKKLLGLGASKKKKEEDGIEGKDDLDLSSTELGQAIVATTDGEIPQNIKDGTSEKDVDLAVSDNHESEVESNDLSPVVKLRPNHNGRNGYKDYPAASKIILPLESDQVPGMACVSCYKGKMYDFKPGIILMLEGSSMVDPIVYIQKKLRCNLCGMMIVSKLPEKTKEGRHSYSLIAQVALQKMLVGVPYHAQAEYQKLLEAPLPASTQWMLMEALFRVGIHVYNAFIQLAAMSWLCTYDDTRCPILEVMSDNKELPDTARKGSNTTGFLFDSPDAPIALYISGRQHAGENLHDILESRPEELGPMHVMADGSSNNNPKELNLNIIMHNCLTHGMRKFTDLGDYYSKEGLKIIEFFSNVYKNDRHTKNLGMSDQERQEHHEKHSTPIMNELKEYLLILLNDKKKCEPNGELYRAINYVLKRWKELTYFLSVPGAPLDSNSVEQLLKVIIRVRKTAMFYKTENSAFISSAILSLIKTSVINDVNPLQYLIAIQRYESDVVESPEKWFPWNYRKRVAEIIKKPNTS